jgi:hypothetical protein
VTDIWPHQADSLDRQPTQFSRVEFGVYSFSTFRRPVKNTPSGAVQKVAKKWQSGQNHAVKNNGFIA